MTKYRGEICFILVLLLKFVYGSDITSIAFGNNINDAIPAAYGDYNSDELTDIFVLRDDFSTIDILFADSKEPLLRLEKNYVCKYPNLKITSVVPGKTNQVYLLII